MRRATPAHLALAILGWSEVAVAQWQPGGAPPAPAPPPWGTMQVGGLAPPPPLASVAPPPGVVKTEELLDASKKKDSGRGLEWFWIAVDGGYERLGLQTFSPNDPSFVAGFVETSGHGGVVSAGLGARLLFFTVGARGRLGFFAKWKTYSAGGELGFHIPLGVIEPHIELGGGWTMIGDVDQAASSLATIRMRGFYLRVGAGLDVYVTRWLSLGAGAGWDVLHLDRPALSAKEITALHALGGRLSDTQRENVDLLAKDGSSWGSGIAVTGTIGLHF